MDWPAEFIVLLVESLAWPAALVLCLSCCSVASSGQLACPLREAEGWTRRSQIEWHETCGVVASTVTALSPQSHTPAGLHDGDLDAELDNLERLISKTPSVALQQTFAVVERELGRIVDERNLERPTNDRRPRR